ncbi:MAG: FG-GAP-like repeat-containing protein [Terriglobia bacterium]
MNFKRPGTVLIAALVFLALIFGATHTWYSSQASQAKPDAALTDQQKLLYHTNVGIAYLEQFNFREAIAEFDQCLKIDPNFVPALVDSALAHYYLQEFVPAEELLKKAVSLAPTQPNTLFALGMIYRNENHADLALQSYSRILEKDPLDSPTLYQVGQIYLKKQDYAKAAEILKKVVQISPYDTSAHYNLATALIRKGDSAEGQKVMETFTQLREKGGISSTGTQYGEQGRYMLAIGEYPDIKSLAGPAAPAPPKPIRFVEATKEAGISFQHQARSSDLQSKAGVVSLWGSGAAFCDYDGDGNLDIYFANSSADKALSRGTLYHNNGKGGFEDVTEKAGIVANGQGMGAYWGDFNNDGHPDLFLTNAGSNLLFQNNGNGTFTDITAKAGVGGGDHWHLSAAIADFDHDGDLDIYVGNYANLSDIAAKGSIDQVIAELSKLPGTGCHLFRNNSNGTFTDVAEEAHVQEPSAKISSTAFTDFDNRRDIDFWTVSQGTAVSLYSNQRIGTFLDVHPELEGIDLKDVFSVTVGDYDKDAWMDTALALQSGPVVLFKNLGNGKFKKDQVLASQNGSAPGQNWTTQFFDYDNDGDLDLLVLKGGLTAERSEHQGPELWENLGYGRFQNVTEKVGLSAFQGRPFRSVSLGDFDNDGDADLLLTVNGGAPLLLRNEGGNQNNWIKIRVRGTNSNKSGIGTKVEVKSGALWQKIEISGGNGYLSQSPPEFIFGLGQHTMVDALRLLWPGGVLQSEINLPINQTKLVNELDRKGTSCPLLYTWNGQRYQFVTDFLGGCAIGYLEPTGQYSTPDTDEYIKISSDQLKLNRGLYSMRINNQLEEVLYIDQTELVVLDHPSELELFPNERLMPEPPFPAFQVIAAQQARPPQAAWDQHHHDVLPQLSAVDRKTVDDFKLLPYKGYAEEHELVLDLGNLSGKKEIQLLMTAWIDYADSTANFKASQSGAQLIAPYLQVKNPKGEWQTVLPSMGFPAGLPKTMVVDLSGKFLSSNYQVRIVTSMRIYWDQILVNTYQGEPAYRLHRLPVQAADLRFRGFPREISPDGKRPFLYDYEQIDPVAPWKSHTGDYTRFGDVTALLRAKEDQYVILRNGDEIQLDFSAAQLPPLPAGWKRSFFLYADGFGKDMDPHSATPDTVEPLPFHRMSRYPYSSNEKGPDSEAFRRYQQEYNTRHVPHVYSQISPSAEK